MTDVPKHFRPYLLLIGLVIALHPCQGFAQSNAETSRTNSQQTLRERDGQHDFDFEIGTWKTHLRRLLHPLTGSTTWVEYEGTTEVRKVWNGRANLVELEVDGPGGHIEALSMRLYNPQSHQWSLNFANSSSGTMGQPTIGEFKNGRGEFFDQETLNGRAIFVRFVISDITPTSCRFEQAFSDDGGKTWEVNWIATDTRVKAESAQQNSDASRTRFQRTSMERDGQHDFDPLLGASKYQLKRLLHLLTGSTTWVDFEGTGVCSRFGMAALSWTRSWPTVQQVTSKVRSCVYTIPKLVSGAFIGPTARMASWIRPRSVNSRMDGVSFTPRTC
jgi:hypothetical protein